MADRNAAMGVGVLGPLVVTVDGHQVEMVGVARSVMALLARTPGRVVAVSAMAEGLWGAHPPARPDKAIASYVSRLRRAFAGIEGLDPARVVVTKPPGYLLDVPESAVDSFVFEAAMAGARRALDAGHPKVALARLRAGLQRWRGEPYGEFGEYPFAGGEAARLRELRIAASQTLVEAELAGSAPGAPESVVAELERLVAEYPHQERLWALLMTALYRLGRQGDALEAYRRARARLAEDLGVDPEPALAQIERAVLAGDPALLGVPVAATRIPDALAAMSGACVGREEELRSLSQALADACRAGQARLIVGGSGLGKTHLVAELCRRAAVDGVVCRYGRHETALAALSADPDRLTLIIIDDADGLPAPARIRIGEWVRVHAALPVLTVVTAAQLPPELSDLQCLRLAPLAASAVAEVVRLYAPTSSELEAISAASSADGVPARVHEVAARWATRQTNRRVHEAVQHGGAPRRQLSEVHDAVVAGALELEQVRARARVARPAAPDVVLCPYKGLARFDTTDADLFHGRERLVGELVARLVGSQLTAVVGPSGSGKSSVVRAGLIPALAAGILPGSAGWRPVITTPTRRDLDACLESNDGKTLVVVDQFEEIFTALDDVEREAFLTLLLDAVMTDKAIGVLTLRSDFYGHCAEYTDLARLISANTVLVGSMAVDELHRAIEQPAQLAGLTLDDGLVDLLVDEVRDAPGGLPLLSTALLNLWENRSGRRLTFAAYRQARGVAGAVEDLGERAYAALDSGQREIARRILLRLADTGGDHAVIRRIATIDEITAVAGQHSVTVLNHLADHRLITLADQSVHVAHEALLTHWQRLRTWLDDDITGRELRSHLTPAATQWAAQPDDTGELYRGARLTAALAWSADHPGELTDQEQAFLTASEQAAVAEQLRRRRTVLRLRALTASLASMLALVIVAGSLALVQRGNAERAALAADIRALRVRAASDERWDRALLAAVQAQRLEPSWDSRAALLSTLQRSPQAIGMMPADSRVLKLALSRDGKRLAVGDNTGKVVVWDTATRRRTAEFAALPFATSGLTISSDGRFIAALAFFSPPDYLTGDNAHLSITDLEARPPTPVPVPTGPAVAIAFQPGGYDLFVRQQNGRLRVMDPATGATVRTVDTPVVRGQCSMPFLNLDPTGRFAATGCAESPQYPAGVWDLTNGKRVWTSPQAAAFLAVNASGAQVIRARRDGKVERIDIATGHTVLVGSHSAAAYSVKWSPTGAYFVTSSDDRTVIVWDARTLRPTVLRGQTGSIIDTAISPDGRTVYSGGLDSFVFAWDLDGERSLAQPLPHGTVATFPDLRKFNDEATLMVHLHADSGRLDLLDLTPQDGPGDMSITSPEFRLPFDMDIDNAGRTAAVIRHDPLTGLTARVVDLVGHRVRPFTVRIDAPSRDQVNYRGVALSADGRFVYAVDFQWRLRRWDAMSGAEVTNVEYRTDTQRYQPGTRTPVDDASAVPFLAADGRTMAIFTDSQTIEFLDVATGRHLSTTRISEPQGPTYPVFSADGRMLAIPTDNGWINIVDSRTGALAYHWVVADGPVSSAAFTPDGRYLLTGSTDGKAVLWQIATAPAGGAVFDLAHAAGSEIAVAAPGDQTLVTVDKVGTVLRWDIDPDHLVAHACAIVARNLSKAEWNQFLPGRAYQETCVP